MENARKMTFQVESGKIRISDPCYGRDVWCTAVIENCASGQWDAAIVEKNGIVTRLVIKHSSLAKFPPLRTLQVKPNGIVCWRKPWEEIDAAIGVDAGMCGFFDDAKYVGWADFADFCYRISAGGVGVLPYGVVSQSGYGDGCYCAFKQTNKEGQVVALALLFG